MRGKLAVSLSGHDKQQVYVIIQEEDAFVYLADGVLKSVAHPKKKNKKHIQIIKQIPEELKELLAEPFEDLRVKRAIKLYMKKQEENECQKQM